METKLKSIFLQCILFVILKVADSVFPMVKDVDKFVDSMPKVELHLHLDGAMSPATLFELAREKGYPAIPDYVKNADDFANFLEMRDNGNLPEFLKKFDFMLPQISGDVEALRRVARDLCETKAREGVVYFETRYAPQLLTAKPNNNNNNNNHNNND